MGTDADDWDPDADLVRELVGVVDRHLTRLDQQIAQSPDPDSLGEFDRGEHVTGLGFVACQTYIAAVCGRARIAKREALELGPSVAGGETAVSLVNHAANYWKHRLERPSGGAAAAAGRRVAAFAAAGLDADESYPLDRVLALLDASRPSRFERVLPLLFAWRRELCSCRRTRR